NVRPGSGVNLSIPGGIAQLIEIAHHGGRRIEIELSTRPVADPEPVGYPYRDEDERSRRGGHFSTVYENCVLALEDVEGFGGVVVDVKSRAEARWLVGFQEREGPTCLVASGLDRHLKPAQIDWLPFAGSKNDDFGHCVTHDDSPPRAKFFGSS